MPHSKQPPIKRIAISTGGGDAPGLNAVIRAAVVSGLKRGWEMYGIRDGFNGLLSPERYPDGGIVALTRESVRGITHLGGTMLGTTNRNNPMRYPITMPDGTVREINRMDEIVEKFVTRGFDALITVGGDGTLTIADVLVKKGLRVIAVPKTIDNDLDKTVVTFGFESAVAFATEALDRLHTTAASHGRILIVEVMGRYAGWIALHSGVAGSADVILIPEIPYNINIVAEKVLQREQRGSNFTLIMVAEGAIPIGGRVTTIKKANADQVERLGGIGEALATELEHLTGKEARVVVLGHLLRGGAPVAFDRLIALRFGAAATRALSEGQSGIMVALDPPQVKYVPIEDAIGQMKAVPLNGDTVQTARDLGVSFGDQT